LVGIYFAIFSGSSCCRKSAGWGIDSSFSSPTRDKSNIRDTRLREKNKQTAMTTTGKRQHKREYFHSDPPETGPGVTRLMSRTELGEVLPGTRMEWEHFCHFPARTTNVRHSQVNNGQSPDQRAKSMDKQPCAIRFSCPEPKFEIRDPFSINHGSNALHAGAAPAQPG